MSNTSCPHCHMGKKPVPEMDDAIDDLAEKRGLNYYEAMLQVGGGYTVCPHCNGTGEAQKQK